MQINNSLIAYKNNIASAHYFFNKSKDELDELNTACNNENPKSIISSVNDLFFYLSNIFTYIDLSSEKSIIYLKETAIYLKSQDIDLISEENIYNNYIIINQNLNELKGIQSIDTYIKSLKREIENIHVLAKDFGFRQTYLSEKNYFDLTKYYLSIIETHVENIKVPEGLPSIEYVFNKASNIENLKKINLNLSRADNYNFYILLDKIIGTENSVFTEFIEINNNVNKNINNIHIKIKDLEKEIEDNKNYLDEDKYLEFNKIKKQYTYNQITFGKYLFNLKNLKNNIEENKIENDKLTKEKEEELNKCEIIINTAKKYNNIYFKEIINNYNTENNYVEKIIICNNLKNALENKTCFEDLEKIKTQNIEDIESYIFVKPTTEKQCLEIINTINYKLNKNQKIILLKEILSENKKITNQINKELESWEIETKVKLKTIEDDIDKLNILPNYKLINDIDKKINEQNKNKIKIIDICINQINKENNYSINFKNNKYYLVVNNPFDITINNRKYDFKNIDYKNIISKTNNLTKHYGKYILYKLYNGKNYYEIEYTNSQDINTEILNIKLDGTLFSTKITNSVLGIYDFYKLEDAIIISEDVDYNGEYVSFITKKINEIVYLKDIIKKQEISNSSEIFTQDKYLVTEIFTLKNIYSKIINTKLSLVDVKESDIFILKEDNKNKPFFIDNNKLIIDIELIPQKEKTYILQTVSNKQDIYKEIDDIILKINKLKNTIFIDIKEKIEKKFSDKQIIKEYSLEEIKYYLSQKQEVNLLINELEKNLYIENKYNILYQKINEKNKDDEENKILENINNNKYKNIKQSYYKLQELLQKIENKEKEKNQQNINEIIKQKKDLDEIIDKYQITEINTTIDDNYLEDEQIINKLNQLKIEINNKLKNKAKNIYDKLNDIIYDLDNEEIDNLINTVSWMFDDVTLNELYAVEYYPIISIKDVERLEKKQKFLDTQKYDLEINNFINNYLIEDYKKALNSLSDNTLSRIEDIYNEKNTINEGINEIKKDSQILLTQYMSENKEENIKTIELAKENYDKGKYLNTITLLKTSKLTANTQTKKQTIILGIIIILFLLSYSYFKENKKKKKIITSYEKKKRVLKYN